MLTTTELLAESSGPRPGRRIEEHHVLSSDSPQSFLHHTESNTGIVRPNSRIDLLNVRVPEDLDLRLRYRSAVKLRLCYSQHPVDRSIGDVLQSVVQRSLFPHALCIA